MARRGCFDFHESLSSATPKAIFRDPRDGRMEWSLSSGPSPSPAVGFLAVGLDLVGPVEYAGVSVSRASCDFRLDGPLPGAR